MPKIIKLGLGSKFPAEDIRPEISYLAQKHWVLGKFIKFEYLGSKYHENEKM